MGSVAVPTSRSAVAHHLAQEAGAAGTDDDQVGGGLAAHAADLLENRTGREMHSRHEAVFALQRRSERVQRRLGLVEPALRKPGGQGRQVAVHGIERCRRRDIDEVESCADSARDRSCPVRSVARRCGQIRGGQNVLESGHAHS